MKRTSIIIPTVFLFLLLWCPKTAAQDPVVRDDVCFAEDNVFQFSAKIPVQLFDNLITRFEAAKASNSTLDAYQIAGFCITPKWVTTSDNPDPCTIHFTTKGFRIFLTLWQDRENSPPAVALFGIPSSFEQGPEYSLMDALSPNFENQKLPADDFFEIIDEIVYDDGREITISSFPAGFNLHQLTREFDLAFLDLNSYEFLANEDNYYASAAIPDPLTRKILIERSFLTIADQPVNGESTLYYRSLICRPFPIPEQLDYASRAAVTFTYPPHCPPYWASGDGGETVSRMVEYSRTYLINQAEADAPIFNWSKCKKDVLCIICCIVMFLLIFIALVALVKWPKPLFRKIIGKKYGPV
jgi:hypothetical protein